MNATGKRRNWNVRNWNTFTEKCKRPAVEIKCFCVPLTPTLLRGSCKVTVSEFLLVTILCKVNMHGYCLILRLFGRVLATDVKLVTNCSDNSRQSSPFSV